MDWKFIFITWLKDWFLDFVNKPKKEPIAEDLPQQTDKNTDSSDTVAEDLPQKKEYMQTIVLSFGHGALDPLTGEYLCLAKGKQFTFKDGEVVFEGVLNRLYQKPIVDAFESEGFNVEVISHEYIDYSLEKRVELAKEVEGPKILICFHHNASRGHNAKGWEIWTSRPDNNSDDLAEYVWFEHFLLKRLFDLKMRGDVVSDGDHDFEENFTEIVAFDGPAIYVENGFFDFKEDLERVRNTDYINLASRALVKGVQKFLKK